MVKSFSSGYGATSWLYQRITAVLMLLFLLLMLALIIMAHLHLNATIISWQNFFQLFIVKLVSQLTLIAIATHAWVGMRDLWMDYIKCGAMRITLYTLTILWLASSIIYAAVILWARG
jgi:succinate dehydrogenase / fumarate reductase membrane anchor subunit